MGRDSVSKPGDPNRAFAVGVALNVAFVALEAAYGLIAGSLALVADAGHNLSDVLGLLLAWGAAVLAARASAERRTYGYRKATVLASLAGALLLLVALAGIAWEAVGRFVRPEPVAGKTVVFVAAIGIAVNTATALLFVSGKKRDLNLRAAFLHMAADAGVSAGVVVAGLLILWRGWLWVDPVISLAIVAVILVGTWGLLRDSINYAMDAVPDDIDIAGIRAYLTGLAGVSRIHDLHVWPLSTTEVALTVHLVIDGGPPGDAFLGAVQRDLHRRFGVGHSTIQIERGGVAADCMLDRGECAHHGG